MSFYVFNSWVTCVSLWIIYLDTERYIQKHEQNQGVANKISSHVLSPIRRKSQHNRLLQWETQCIFLNCYIHIFLQCIIIIIRNLPWLHSYRLFWTWMYLKWCHPFWEWAGSALVSRHWLAEHWWGGSLIELWRQRCHSKVWRSISPSRLATHEFNWWHHITVQLFCRYKWHCMVIFLNKLMQPTHSSK